MTSSLRIACLGASMTAGTPGFFSPRERPPEGEGDPRSQYAYWMKKMRPDWEVLNRGMRGQRTDQILMRFDYDVLDLKADGMILLAGTNDLYQGRKPEVPLQNLQIMFERALAAGIVPVSASIPPLNPASPELKQTILDFNKALRALTAKLGIVFCDIYPVLEDPLNPGFIANSPDDVHPDIEGYRRMAEALVPTLEKALRQAARL